MLLLTEEQKFLAETAQSLIQERAPLSVLREQRSEGVGFSRSLWSELSALGWAGMPFPESVGGMEMGLSDVVVVMEALGANLVSTPMISSVLLSGACLQQCPSDELSSVWLPKIASGSALVSMAWVEPGMRHDLAKTKTTVRSGGVLTGEKWFVEEGNHADAYVVVARGADGLGAHFVLREDVTVTAQSRLDGRDVARLQLDNVPATPLSGVDLGVVFDRAVVGLCGEMLGSMSALLAMTLEYLKTRKQFGVPIGTFQTLQHRAARVFIEHELSRSAVMAAARAADTDPESLPQLAALAKARCSDALMLTVHEGIQMHGGIGMTDEHDVGLYAKRARVAEMTMGDASWHRKQWATRAQY